MHIIFEKKTVLKISGTFLYIITIVLVCLIHSCTTLDTFEKNVSIPNHAWNSDFKPEIEFEIQDTSSRYNIFVVIRHTDAYRYNNIWMNVYMQFPGDTIRKQQLDIRLATDDRGWLGSGMDDIFEHRVLVTQEPQYLRTPGIYKFRLENIMRENPLEYVMNVGIRVEKEK